QGIVHGTTITVLNAGRIKLNSNEGLKGKLFVTSGLGGMSGAQAKAGVIAGAVTVVAEINPKVAQLRHSQGWVNELFVSLDQLIDRIKIAQTNKEAVSLAYQGNIVELWEKFLEEDMKVDLGSDQTSLHNPYAGGYYPVDLSFEESNTLMAENQEKFKELVKATLVRHVQAIDKLTEKGMYFWDYGNAFLLEASRAGADVMQDANTFKYPSYVEDIMGPMCFDYGFGPFRWVCTSGDPKDLDTTDEIASKILEELLIEAPEQIKQQLEDNLHWIKSAKENKLVVGSQARILYANTEGRTKIAQAFNQALKEGKISAPIVLGRDHHDVSGTDSPYRETANIYDGSRF
ncbi:urocanate hydratase, partial [bacterium]